MTNKKETKKPEKAEEVSVRIVPKKARKELPREGAKKAEKIARKSARQAARKEKAPVRRWRRAAVAFLITTVVLAGSLVAVVVRDMVAVTQKRSSLPEIRVSLADVTIEEINAGEKTVKYPGNQVTLAVDGVETVFEGVEIKGRGNSTWIRPKRPYQLKLAYREDLLGLGKARKWVLLANYLDVSNLKTEVAFWLQHLLNEDFALDGEFVELYVDDVYEGLYYMTHKMNIGKEEINLHDGMGVLMEMDNIYGIGLCDYVSREENCFTVKDVVAEDNTAKAVADFGTAFDRLEKAAKAGDWDTVQEVVDVKSLAKYYILSEFSVNLDAYKTSYYFYKDGMEDKIHAGPGWDFDMAFGSQYLVETKETEYTDPLLVNGYKKYAYGFTVYDGELNKNVRVEADRQVSRLMYDLLEIPEFRALVETVWREKMLGHENELTQYIRGMAAYIRDAALRDEARWKQSGFDEDVEYLVDWVRQRYETLNREYGMINDYGENR